MRRFRPGLDYTVAHYGILTKDPQLDAVLCFVDDRSEEDKANWGDGEVRVGGARMCVLCMVWCGWVDRGWYVRMGCGHVRRGQGYVLWGWQLRLSGGRA